MPQLRELVERGYKVFQKREVLKAIQYYWRKDIYPDLEWNLHWKHWLSVQRFRSLHDKHKGERCFIIGNGPSLNKMDLSNLRNEITFGLNRIYLMFPRIGFSTSYIVSVNELVIEQFADEIDRLSMPKFISWHVRGKIPFSSQMMFVRDKYDDSFGFSKKPGQRIWEGATVTYTAMQIAYYLGFQQVILIGVDHSFSAEGKPHEEIVSQGPDANHFSPDYFAKGYRWQLPDLETSEMAYRLARSNFESAGREILDATIDGKLTVFPKVDYDSLF